VWPTATAITLLADWVDSVETFISVFVAVYILLIFAYILTSWIRLPYQPWLNRIQRFLYDVCEPYLRLFRRILPSVGPLDLSPIIAIIALYVAQQILFSLLDALR
jgi:YggT family protein